MSDLVVVAIIAALPPTLAVVMARRATKAQMREVHDLVNSRLEAALTTIKSLEAEVRRLTTQRETP